MGAPDRSRLIDARLHAQTLDVPAPGLADLPVALLGAQDAGTGTAEAGLALRLAGGAETVGPAIADGALVQVMSFRGAPHLHRAHDVPLLRSALRPASAADLEATCGRLPPAVLERDDPVGEVAQVLHRLVPASGPRAQRTKAALSTDATPRLDPVLTPFCTPCEVHHAIDGLFRLATLRAGLQLVPGVPTQTFRRLADPPGDTDAVAARKVLAETAVRACTPVDAGQVAAWFGWHTLSVRTLLRDRALLDRGAEVHDHDTGGGGQMAGGGGRSARLLPARDVWLRGSDRGWLLGGRTERRGEVFKALGAPGVVLLDGELAGTWRARAAGTTHLVLEISPWQALSRSQVAQLGLDAEVIAATRGRDAELVVSAVSP